MSAILLIDFGSTYTKLTAIDLTKETIIGTAQSMTTVNDYILNGYEKAYQQLVNEVGHDIHFEKKLACSSARGGFKIIVIGLTKSMTAEAAKRTALGAGARILKVYAPELTASDLAEIEQLSPDILLLSGGTDGGNHDYIIRNAKRLTRLKKPIPIVVAGNQAAYHEIEKIFMAQQVDFILTENVMPKANILNAEPTRDILRQLFMEKIVEAKGLTEVEANIGKVLLPTPSAVLKAASILAMGTEQEAGIGDLVVVDIGGATTDLHSIGAGRPTNQQIMTEGLQEPFEKRTVEGDLGMRYSAGSLYEAVGSDKIASHLKNQQINIAVACAYREAHPDMIPTTQLDKDFDAALASCAVDEAFDRHAGFLRRVATPNRYIYYQTGKDLTKVKAVIGTGGVLVHSQQPVAILATCLQKTQAMNILRPQEPAFYLDKHYILSAMGLLAEEYPEIAIRIMKKYLFYLTG